MKPALHRSQEKVRLRLSSAPGWQRPAFIPTVIVLAAGLLLSLSLLSFSLIGLLHHIPEAAMIVRVLISAVIFLIVLSIFTWRYFGDFVPKYLLELTDEELRLRVSGRNRKAALARMDFSEVAFVEYFTPTDNASFLFHGKDGRIIEVPAWSLTRKPYLIEEFLIQKKVPILRS